MPARDEGTSKPNEAKPPQAGPRQADDRTLHGISQLADHEHMAGDVMHDRMRHASKEKPVRPFTTV
jgi:hypothetical protein